MGFRATSNFRKFKVALNVQNFFKLCQKCILSFMSKFYN